LEDPIVSIAETVLSGMGATARSGGERLDSSQPAKSPPTGMIKEKTRVRFANGLHSIDRSPDEPFLAAPDHLTPAPFCKSYQNLDLSLTILEAD
jgi:hypothetical protein